MDHRTAAVRTRRTPIPEPAWGCTSLAPIPAGGPHGHVQSLRTRPGQNGTSLVFQPKKGGTPSSHGTAFKMSSSTTSNETTCNIYYRIVLLFSTKARRIFKNFLQDVKTRSLMLLKQQSSTSSCKLRWKDNRTKLWTATHQKPPNNYITW